MSLQFALIVLTANLLAVAFDDGRPFAKYYGLAGLDVRYRPKDPIAIGR